MALGGGRTAVAFAGDEMDRIGEGQGAGVNPRDQFARDRLGAVGGPGAAGCPCAGTDLRPPGSGTRRETGLGELRQPVSGIRDHDAAPRGEEHGVGEGCESVEAGRHESPQREADDGMRSTGSGLEARTPGHRPRVLAPLVGAARFEAGRTHHRGPLFMAQFPHVPWNRLGGDALALEGAGHRNERPGRLGSCDPDLVRRRCGTSDQQIPARGVHCSIGHVEGLTDHVPAPVVNGEQEASRQPRELRVRADQPVEFSDDATHIRHGFGPRRRVARPATRKRRSHHVAGPLVSGGRDQAGGQHRIDNRIRHRIRKTAELDIAA